MATVSEASQVWWETKIGKHSYGSICRDHLLIESIGAF